jgi:hypothetical protein
MMLITRALEYAVTDGGFWASRSEREDERIGRGSGRRGFRWRRRRRRSMVWVGEMVRRLQLEVTGLSMFLPVFEGEGKMMIGILRGEGSGDVS